MPGSARHSAPPRAPLPTAPRVGVSLVSVASSSPMTMCIAAAAKVPLSQEFNREGPTMKSFSDLLEQHVTRVGIPIRTISKQSKIPHQTLYNWLNGARPRRSRFLKTELNCLADALGLDSEERDELLRAAGCLPQTTRPTTGEVPKMADHSTIPRGWFAAGHSPNAFDMGVMRAEGVDDVGALFLRALPAPPGFGTLMQNFRAEKYLGVRIRFSAETMSIGIVDWAGLWMRVDDDKRESPSFDNMGDRPIKGTTEWTRHDVVLDVPANAVLIAFGVLLDGEGEVRIRNLIFEVVGRDVPTTGKGPTRPQYPDEPLNLDIA